MEMKTYTPDELADIIETARAVCAAWLDQPPFVIAARVAALRQALESQPDKSNGRVVAVAELGATCSLTGG